MDFYDDDDDDFSAAPKTEEDRLLKIAKMAAFTETKRWIEKITNKTFLHQDDFRRSLSDGILLCSLLNSLKPGSIKRINKISTALSGYDNIGKFLRVCEEEFGLNKVILFETSDLEDLSNKSDDMTVESDRRLQKVLICLFHLAKSVENIMTNEVLDPQPFRILLQSQDHNVMRRLKSQSLSAPSTHDKSLSKLIQNQNPNYLASTAQETLKKTELNQSLFHKSADNDEWQESLENWKEKRRQVISNPLLDDNFERAGDNQELLDLKERARKMKLQRDQLKDQSNVAKPYSNIQVPKCDSSQVLDIDEETKAMIERVKQRKLAEENRRRFSLSPPLSGAFVSDSELSTSTTVDTHEKEVLSSSGRNDIPEKKISEEPHLNNIVNHSVDDLNVVKDETLVKGRVVNVKLSRMSKQDSDKSWGMEVMGGVNGAVVSKVKIGSCADVCEVRKGDEIISINSEDVSSKSVEYIRSLFGQGSSDICRSESLRLCLRRPFNDDEEDDFFNSDQSDVDVVEDSSVDKLSRHIHEPEVHDIKDSLEESESNQEIHPCEEKAVLSNVINTCETLSKVQESQSAVESIFHDEEDTTSPLRNNLASIYPDVLKTSENGDFEKENNRKLSVQEKIAKIESQNIINTLTLSSSWNMPKKSDIEPVLIKSSTCISESTEHLSSNSDKGRQMSSINSSLSNLYHYWETEAPKSVSSVNTNIISKSAPLMQVPLSSITGDHDNIEMEIAEQHLDLSNVNLEETWRTVDSSCNSSTSDDISALNDTIGKVNYPENGSENINSAIGPTYSEDCHIKNLNATGLSVTNASISLVENNTMEDVRVPEGKTAIITSTGVQADLVEKRKPTNYTTITTSCEGRFERPRSFPSSKLSDEESCSFTISRNQRDQQDNNTSTALLKDSSCYNLHSFVPNQNDFSKDYTTVTAVSKVNKKESNQDPCSARSNESTVTGVSRDMEKSVEIEVSLTPQLFPIRNKTLLAKNLKDRKNEVIKNNECSLVSDNSFAEDNTLLITNLDEAITAIKHVPQYYKNPESQKDEANPSVSISQQTIARPYVEVLKKSNNMLQTNMPVPNGYFHSYKDPLTDKSQSLHTTVTTDPSMSIISVPTLFKGVQKNENISSHEQLSTKSENSKPKRIEPVISSKKIKKGHSAENNHLSEFKRSSSSKELRFEEVTNEKDEVNKRRSSFIEEQKHNTLNDSKYSAPPFLQARSNFSLPSSTNIKSHVKSYNIERPVKQVSFNQNPENKKSQKPVIPKETKSSMKCNYCSSLVGLEDLMVIEELNLHFHLRCFICSECSEPLGDGKSDTDVRIRRSKLHCLDCYNKKSSRSKHRLGALTSKASQPLVNISQNKETEI